MSLGDEDIDWKKVLLLTGKPGTGKTHCLKQAIYEAIDQERDVLVDHGGQQEAGGRHISS